MLLGYVSLDKIYSRSSLSHNPQTDVRHGRTIFYTILSFIINFQTVLNQLTSGPQSDSFMSDMADEAEGSGEGSGDGKNNSGWEDEEGSGSDEPPTTTPTSANGETSRRNYSFFSPHYIMLIIIMIVLIIDISCFASVVNM